jgi:hypothetical protein
MKARLQYCDKSNSLSIIFPKQSFLIKGIDLLNMKDVRNLILVKDRAVDCLMWVNDERVGKLAQFLIQLPDGMEIEDEITVELKDNLYSIKIDKNLEYVEFLKQWESKPYKVKKQSCNCMAWIFSKAKPKTCKHCDMLSLMGIELKEPPKKPTLEKEERRKWNSAFKKEKIKDKEAQNWIILNSQQLILDYNATTLRQWYEVYQKVKSGEVTFTKQEER